MIGFLKKFFSPAPSVNLKELVKNGAAIVDVRTRAEYQGGHVNGSINMPLNELQQSASRLNKAKPVITCCASGMRSATAKSLLKDLGFSDVHNGGGWTSLNNKLR
ncbi:MAG: rhodanese-like domain-containing protein [Bacteroidota bacterium]